MTMKPFVGASRRTFLSGAAATAGLAAASSLVPTTFAIGQTAKVKVGFLLPYSGTYAQLGHNITNALKMRVMENGNKLGGRDVDYIAVDSEAAPPKAAENTAKLVDKEKVDFVIGPVHSGVAAVMAKIIGERGAPIMICPNAGANDVTRGLCAKNIFRTSFSNWQAAYPGGTLMAGDGHKTCVMITWKYPAGMEMMAAAKETFEKAGGKVIKEIYLPFPDVEFQAHLTEIAALKPNCVYSFFSGGGCIKFLKDYAAAGLKASIPLYGPGFLTDGVLEGAGEAGEGIKTTSHYCDDLPTEMNQKFRADFRKAYKTEPDVFAVQGFDTGSLLIHGLDAVKGDAKALKGIIKAMEVAKLNSPRGLIAFDKNHNVLQDIYLRISRKGVNSYVKTIVKQLADPGTGCKM